MKTEMSPNYLAWSQAWTLSTATNFSPDQKLKGIDLTACQSSVSRRLHHAVSSGELPYVAMDYAEELTESLKELTPYLQSFKHMLLLGIGGSALGARALQKAFYPQQDWPGYPLNPNDRILWIADNVDPETLPAWFERLPAKDTLVVVISKSGGTIETMAQYFLAKEWLEKELPEDKPQDGPYAYPNARTGAQALNGTDGDLKSWQDHLVFITDEHKGFLRQQANLYNIRTLPVPEHLGGRYSVLCAVGLVPAAFLGMDWQALLDGAKELVRPFNQAKNPEQMEKALNDHPAWNMALWAESLMQRGFNELIYFTYVPKFAAFGSWFAQLWAESLGKNGLGSMPLPAVGVTDQHSLQQMFLDGPRNKGCIFISGGGLPKGPSFPAELPSQWDFLQGHNLHDLLAAEALGTRMALAECDVPLLEIRLGSTNENTAGRLMTLLGLTTIFTGWLMDINPLDQPAVELGKRLANASLGASGLKEEKKKLFAFSNAKETIQEF